ncbi:MAG: CinA family protein [Nitrospiraceae bacterium]|nr:CinA family protein [Nitrospiraceae bacterium]
MDRDFPAVVRDIKNLMQKQGLMLSVAESCTGGCIANALTSLPGASKFFSVSIVSYSEDAKRSILKISPSVLKKHGVISEETAVAMARAVGRLSGTHVSLAVTGNAGPEALEGKDIGLVYIAAKAGDVIESKGIVLKGGRQAVKKAAALESLRFLRQVLRVWL